MREKIADSPINFAGQTHITTMTIRESKGNDK